jgi:hypothetical protein
MLLVAFQYRASSLTSIACLSFLVFGIYPISELGDADA